MKDPILAKAFAHADDTEQAGLIDSIARELFVLCGGRFSKRNSMAGYESQLCAISQKLGKDGIAFIKDLHEFIVLREKDIR